MVSISRQAHQASGSWAGAGPPRSAPRNLAPMRGLRLAAVALVVLLAGACGSSSDAGSTRSQAPLPAGTDPSEISKMVCASEAQTDIMAVLGVSPTKVETPTWADHLYSCRYVYSDGSFVLSVKELSSEAETQDYLRTLSSRLGNAAALPTLGEGSFSTANGSVVVRKDWKVLLVDDTGLPAEFGDPPISPAKNALAVANVILGCWAGD